MSEIKRTPLMSGKIEGGTEKDRNPDYSSQFDVQREERIKLSRTPPKLGGSVLHDGWRHSVGAEHTLEFENGITADR